LYHLIAGRPPFPEGGVAEKLCRHAADTPAPLNQLRFEVPEGLARVVERMMAKRPEDRYQTPAEVANALAPFASVAPARRQLGRRFATGLVVATLVATLAAAAAVRFRAEEDRGNVLTTDDPEIDKGDEVRQFRVGGSVRGMMCGRVTFSPGGDLAVSSGDSVRVWDVQTGRMIREMAAEIAGTDFGVALSPDGRRLLVRTHLFDLETGTELRNMQQPRAIGEGMWGVAFSPDGRRAVFGGEPDPEAKSETLWLSEVETGALLKCFGQGEGVRSVAYSPDGSRIAAGHFLTSHGAPSHIRVYDVETGKGAPRLPDPEHGRQPDVCSGRQNTPLGQLQDHPPVGPGKQPGS
jgi:hypothetical protein